MAPSILIDGQPDQDVVTITNTGVLLAMYSWTPATRNVDLFGAQRIPFKRPAGSGRSDVVIKLRGAADVVSVAGEIPARNGEVLREEVLLVSADIQAGTDTVLATGLLPEPRALPSSEWTCCPPSCTGWETRWGCRKPRAGYHGHHLAASGSAPAAGGRIAGPGCQKSIARRTDRRSATPDC